MVPPPKKSVQFLATLQGTSPPRRWLDNQRIVRWNALARARVARAGYDWCAGSGRCDCDAASTAPSSPYRGAYAQLYHSIITSPNDIFLCSLFPPDGSPILNISLSCVLEKLVHSPRFFGVQSNFLFLLCPVRFDAFGVSVSQLLSLSPAQDN